MRRCARGDIAIQFAAGFLISLDEILEVFDLKSQQADGMTDALERSFL